MNTPTPRLVLPLVLVAAACSTVPETGRNQFLLTSAGYENRLGAQAYDQILAESPVETGTPRARMVEEVGMKVARASGYDYDWEVTLIDEPGTVNAFALPGGKMAVYTGILPVTRNEDGLATVLGHEVAHVTARHGGERMSHGVVATAVMGAASVGLSLSDMEESDQQGIIAALGAASEVGVILPFSREHESEADEIGLRFMVRAGYDPHEAPKVWERMAELSPNRPPEFLSTHPDPENRAERLRELIPRVLAEERGGSGP